MPLCLVYSESNDTAHKAGTIQAGNVMQDLGRGRIKTWLSGTRRCSATRTKAGTWRRQQHFYAVTHHYLPRMSRSQKLANSPMPQTRTDSPFFITFPDSPDLHQCLVMHRSPACPQRNTGRQPGAQCSCAGHVSAPHLAFLGLQHTNLRNQEDHPPSLPRAVPYAGLRSRLQPTPGSRGWHSR